MSILEQVLLGVADGLAENIPDSDIDVLRSLVKPDSIDNRKAAAQLLIRGIGYDPETYWNRREITEICLASSDEVDEDGQKPDVSDAAIDAALERYEGLRSALLGIAALDKDYVVITDPSDPSKRYAQLSDFLTPTDGDEDDDEDGDGDGGMGIDDEDSPSDSLTEEARRESDDEDDDDPPEVIDDDEWGGNDDE